MRDNKSILNYLYNKVYPYNRDVIVSVRVKYCLGDTVISTSDYHIGVIVKLMSYKGSGKDYRHIVSVTDIVNNNIPTNIKHLDKNMKLILSSKCVCTVDIGGSY